MNVYELVEELGAMRQADDLPVMLSIEGLWFEVVATRYDEDRVLLSIEPR